MKVEDKELSQLILDRLRIIDHEIEPFVDPQIKMLEDAVAQKEMEIEAILIEKGLLVKDQAIIDIKTKTEIIAESRIGE
jgi:hypothetical protein